MVSTGPAGRTATRTPAARAAVRSVSAPPGARSAAMRATEVLRPVRTRNPAGGPLTPPHPPPHRPPHPQPHPQPHPAGCAGTAACTSSRPPDRCGTDRVRRHRTTGTRRRIRRRRRGAGHRGRTWARASPARRLRPRVTRRRGQIQGGLRRAVVSPSSSGPGTSAATGHLPCHQQPVQNAANLAADPAAGAARRARQGPNLRRLAS
jgi:hypothetical protein